MATRKKKTETPATPDSNFALPPVRCFTVRRYHPTGTGVDGQTPQIEEIPVLAHFVTPQGDVLFFSEVYLDLDAGQYGTRITRGFLGWLDYEERAVPAQTGTVQ